MVWNNEYKLIIVDNINHYLINKYMQHRLIDRFDWQYWLTGILKLSYDRVVFVIDSCFLSLTCDWCLSVIDRSFFDVSDGIFLNYTWNDNNLQRSRELAEQSGRPYDVYVGVDVYGRGCRGGGGFNTKEVQCIFS